MTLEILKYPDARLKERSKNVETFDAKLHTLLDNMAETMYAANGVGLAAPQVGHLLRAFVIDIGEADADLTEPSDAGIRKLMEFINPEILGGEGKAVFEEGCLSVPGVTESVTRKDRITVRYQDRNGKSQTLDAHSLLSVAIQHENDHLDGVLFIERLSPLKRRLTRRKLDKAVTL